MTQRPSLVLVVPPQLGLLEGFSSGLISLANFTQTALPAACVQLLDLSLATWEQVSFEVKEVCCDVGGPIFVGITTTTASYQSALRTARAFKSIRSECLVILGGHHASPEAGTILRWHSEVDFVIKGEGEVALVALLTSFPDIRQVPNLVYRDGESVRSNPQAPLLQQDQLDRLLPEFAGEALCSSPGKFGHVTYVSARGCPLPCAFCAVAGESIRTKSVQAVINDLRFLVQERRFNNIAIEDNFFAHSRDRTLALCAAIARLQLEQPFRWDCQTRVESLRREDIIQSMARAGCEAVYLGVEAFHPDHLLYLRKTSQPRSYIADLEQIIVPRVLESNMLCYLNLQVGFPGESRAHRDATLFSLERIASYACLHSSEITIFPQLHVVYPGTAHWDMLSRSTDTFIGGDIFEYFTAWEGESSPILRWLGKRFAHGTGGIPIGILDLPLRFPIEDNTGPEINPVAIMALESYLDDIASIPGLSVFRYGNFLARHRD
jgi:anaerobic magnesium-protoporphyrin IX monomethyl ester cyclase